MGDRITISGMKTYIVGRGNLGSHIESLLLEHSISISYIPFAELERAIQQIQEHAVIWLCIPDKALPELIARIENPNIHIIYCSGITELKEEWKLNCAVWYPLYSFRKGQFVDWSKVPILCESNNTITDNYFRELNGLLNLNVRNVDSQTRGSLHLAAVFVNNFVNAVFNATETVLEKHQIAALKSVLIPIAEQTLDKWKHDTAQHLQTGPAMRDDRTTIAEHLKQLTPLSEEMELYQVLTEYIQQKIKQNN